MTLNSNSELFALCWIDLSQWDRIEGKSHIISLMLTQEMEQQIVGKINHLHSINPTYVFVLLFSSRFPFMFNFIGWSVVAQDYQSKGINVGSLSAYLLVPNHVVHCAHYVFMYVHSVHLDRLVLIHPTKYLWTVFSHLLKHLTYLINLQSF